MLTENKVCDGADWFDTDFHNFATNPDWYGCIPRFHRKQWEFVKICMTLNNRAMLGDGKKGLSMGSGRERLIFCLLPHVGELHATDLYNQSAWGLSGAKENARQFVLNHSAVGTTEALARRLHVKDMDMRNITYEDETFDFAYSSCAVEHIGTTKDFLEHFNEVYRVLKPGGMYVFTTEFGFMDNSVMVPGNWCFGTEEMGAILNALKFNVDSLIDCTLFEHSVNSPTHISQVAKNHIAALPQLSRMYPHIILWPTNNETYCFTSACFALVKEKRPAVIKFEFRNITKSIEFLKRFRE